MAVLLCSSLGYERLRLCIDACSAARQDSSQTRLSLHTDCIMLFVMKGGVHAASRDGSSVRYELYNRKLA